MLRTSEPLRVVVAGGGVAAAETAAHPLLALRALAGDRVDLELITDRPVDPFNEAAEDAGATLTIDRIEAVAPELRELRLASGGRRPTTSSCSRSAPGPASRSRAP